MAKLSDLNGTPIPLSIVGSDADLVLDIQNQLSNLGYLDPPSDGLFGQISVWALQEFCYRQGFSVGAGFSKEIAQSLLEPQNVLPEIDLESHWLGKAIGFGLAKGHWFNRHPECWNILYIEGLDCDGTLNEDAPNKFNDVRSVFRVRDSGKLEVYCWEGTTEPGTFWTFKKFNPEVNENGAARIAFGQYKSWRLGYHRNNHEALVQVEPVTVYRDLNEDYSRNEDLPDTGIFGINQHWGYDLPKDDLGNSSAGCLVGRTKSGHKEFMSIVKSDARFQANPGYKFMTSIVPADEIY